MPVELKWWGRASDAQEYAVGPCASQEEAHAAAVAARLGLQENGWLHFDLFEAAAQPFWLADWIGAEFAVEIANDDLLENGPTILPGRSGVFSADEAQKRDLALSLHAAAEAWQRRHGLSFSAPILDAFRLVNVSLAPFAPELQEAAE